MSHFSSVSSRNRQKQDFDEDMANIEQTNTVLNSIENRLSMFIRKNKENISQQPMNHKLQQLEDEKSQFLSMTMDENAPLSFLQSRNGNNISMAKHIKNKEELEDELVQYKNKLKNLSDQPLISPQKNQNGSVLNHLNKIEQFYQTKTKILQERIDFLENEVQRVSLEKTEIFNEKNQLKTEYNALKNSFQMKLEQQLIQQENKLKDEYNKDLQSYSDRQQKTLGERSNLLSVLDQLKNEKKQLLDELDSYKQNNKHLEDEKNNISVSYNNLMSLHNQILQMDIQKNEKNLQISCVNNSVSSDRERRLVTQETIMEKKQLFDALHNYRNELDSYKVKSDQDGYAMKQQLSTLRQQLEQYKFDNLKLNEELKNFKSFEASKQSYQGGNQFQNQSQMYTNPSNNNTMNMIPQHDYDQPHNQQDINRLYGQIFQHPVNTSCNTSLQNQNNLQNNSQQYSRKSDSRQNEQNECPLTNDNLKSRYTNSDKKQKRPPRKNHSIITPNAKSSSQQQIFSHKGKPNKIDNFEQEVKRLKNIVNDKITTKGKGGHLKNKSTVSVNQKTQKRKGRSNSSSNKHNYH